MIYLRKINFLFYKFNIFSIFIFFLKTITIKATNRLIFHNIKDNFIKADEHIKVYKYINEDFLKEKIEYYIECYEYSKNPDKVTEKENFTDYDKETAKDNLLICFCDIQEEEKDRKNKNLTDLNYIIEFEFNNIVNKDNIDDKLYNDDKKNEINKNDLKFKLLINKAGVKLIYIDKNTKKVFKTENLDNGKWALFELKTKKEEIDIKEPEKYNSEESTKYLFVSDINSIDKIKKKAKELFIKYVYVISYNSLFKETINNNINIIFCNTKNVINLNNLFYCKYLESVENFKIIDTANVKSMSGTFSSEKLKKIDFSNLNTCKVEYMEDIFSNICLEKIEFGENFKTDNVKSIAGAFSSSKIKEIDLSKFNFSNVEYIKYLFSCCENLEKVNMSNLNLEKINEFNDIFQYCKNLKEINLDGIKFKNLENINSLFYGCESLKNIDLSFLKNSSEDSKSLKLKEMMFLFNGCTNLENINFGDYFDTSNVEIMMSMFKECKNLKKLDLSKFNTSKVKDMELMFYNSIIKELILPENFIPKGCRTKGYYKEEKYISMFEGSVINNMYVNGKKLKKNLKNYELFTRYPDKYLKYGDNLDINGEVISKCCCCTCCPCCINNNDNKERSNSI